MKKIRIMLTSALVLTVVGGALAFKAHKAFGGDYICTTNSNTTICNLPDRYTIPAGGTTETLFCKTAGAPSTEKCAQLNVTKDL